MSQNRELNFIEPEPGKWYSILEDPGAPGEAWDWREYATCYGPYPDLGTAMSHMTVSTPGSYTVPYEFYRAEPILDRLIQEATLDIPT